MNRKYKCDICKGVFEDGWSAEEAEKEAQDIFGKPSKDWQGGRSIVCDDCFNKIHPSDNKELVEKTKQII